jgi:hypothetical protein
MRQVATQVRYFFDDIILSMHVREKKRNLFPFNKKQKSNILNYEI